MNFLSLENVSKSYGDKILFEDISLQINKGQKVALVAKNGSGKSTLLRVITGQEPSEGEKSTVLRRKDIRLGFLIQEPEFHSEQTVLEAIFDSDNPITKAVKRYELAIIVF